MDLGMLDTAMALDIDIHMIPGENFEGGFLSFLPVDLGI